MSAMLSKTLGQVGIERPVSRSPLHLFPFVGGTTSAEDGLALLDAALEGKTLRVEELDEDGSVSELRIINGGAMPVLILEGDELIGAKQNRTVNSSVLVAPETSRTLGRWPYRRHPWRAESPKRSRVRKS
jgi:hypothetical protein